MKRLAILLMTLAVVSAGCLKGSPGDDGTHPSGTGSATSSGQPTTPPSGCSGDECPPPPQSPAKPVRFDYNDCTILVANFNAPQDTVQARLPEGYMAVDSVGGTTVVSTEVIDCRSMVLDNRTVLGPTRTVSLMAAVHPPPEETASDDFNAYVFETIATDAKLAARLTDGGFAGRLGTVTVTFDGPTYTVTAEDGDTAYSLTLTGQQPSSGFPFTRVYRYHHQVDGINYWLNSTVDNTIVATPLAGSFTAEGGIGADLAFPANPAPVGATLYEGRIRLDFKS